VHRRSPDPAAGEGPAANTQAMARVRVRLAAVPQPDRAAEPGAPDRGAVTSAATVRNRVPPAGRLRAPPAIGLLTANVGAVRRPRPGLQHGQVTRTRVRTEIENRAGVPPRALLARPPAAEHPARDRSAAARGTGSDQATSLPRVRTAHTGQTVPVIVSAQPAVLAPEVVRGPIRIAPAGPTAPGAVPNREHLPQRRARGSETRSDRRHEHRPVRQP